MNFRTTLAQETDGSWQLVEMCERMVSLEDLAQPLYEGDTSGRCIITILTKNYISDHAMDLAVESEELHIQPTSSGADEAYESPQAIEDVRPEV